MFALYRRGKKLNQWQFVREVTLAGILAKAIADSAESKKPRAKSTMTWELDREALRKAVMQTFGVDGPVGELKVLIDVTLLISTLDPGTPTAVSRGRTPQATERTQDSS
jgi:hypothetical protein